MRTQLSQNRMYKALVDKDASFEGSFIAGVKTTGIFCRPTCRARKPKRENVEFFRNAQEALQRGYRPCKICRPMAPANETPDWLKPLLKHAELNDHRLGDSEIRSQGIDPNRVRRWFKQNHNITFQSYLRSLRLGRAFGHLTDGGKVIDTAFNHGYESLSGFSSAFKKLTGEAPKKAKGTDALSTYQILTPLGPMIAGATSKGLSLLEFTDRRGLEKELIDLQKRLSAPIVTQQTPLIKQVSKQLKEYFAGSRTEFDIPLHTPGTEFQNKVWKELQRIPYGKTRSYKQQAHALKNPKAVRAVARANGQNRIAIIIPCHRVIGSDGQLTGYAGGLERKRKLLELEAEG